MVLLLFTGSIKITFAENIPITGPVFDPPPEKVVSEESTWSINMDYPVIAMVKPVFTATAYSGFYNCFGTSQDYENCFDLPLVNSWSTSSGATSFITMLKSDGYPASNIITISDLSVHNGEIFDEFGQPKYDTIVFFHNEYVTLKEYHNMVNFIKAGGNVIILNGNAFFAEVIYDNSTNRVKLVSGHAWNFDGKNGTKADVYKSRFTNGIFNNEHQFWFGSRYTAYNKGSTSGAHFRTISNNPHPIAVEMQREGIEVMSPTYRSHEENTMITPNAHIIADWKTSFVQKDRGIKIYEIFPEGPIGGSLIHFGFFGTDVLKVDYSARRTFVTAVRHQAGYYKDPWIKYPNDNAVLRDNVVLDFVTGWKTEIIIDEILYPSLSRGSKLDFLGEGRHKLEIKFTNENYTALRSVNFSIDRTPPKFLFNNQSTFVLPIDYPNTPVNVTLEDNNPEYMRIRVINGTSTSFIRATESGELAPMSIRMNRSDLVYLSFEGIDSAGNSVLQWYKFDTGNNINLTREIQPNLEKLNATHFRVSIPKIDSYVSGRLQISEDYGANWINIPFTEYNFTNDREYAYYEKNSDELIYRIAVNADGKTYYFRNIKSYHWDNTVYSIKNHNITGYTKNYNNYMLHLHKSQIQRTSIEIQWLHENGTVFDQQNLGYNSDRDQLLYTTIPKDMIGKKTIRVLIISDELVWSKEFQVLAGYNDTTKSESVDVVVNSNQVVSLTDFGSSLPKIDTVQINLITNELITERIIGINSMGTFSFLVLPEYLEMKIYGYDINGNLIMVLNFYKGPDVTSPIIKFEEQVFIYDQEKDVYLIQWEIYDDSPGSYEIYLNNSLVKNGIFSNIENVTISLVNMEIGNYNYTIIVTDEANNTASSTTILHILENLITPSIISEENIYLYENELLDYSLQWEIFDDNPDRYELYENNSLVQSGKFTNYENVSYSISNLLVGNYYYTIVVYDKSGNVEIFTTILHVLEYIIVYPTIYSDEYIIINETERTNFSLQWKVFAEEPSRYELYQNYIMIKFGEFTNDQNITLSVSDMKIGTYNITLVIFDKSGTSSSYTMILNIIEDKQPPKTSIIVTTDTSTTITSTPNISILPTSTNSSSNISSKESDSPFPFLVSLMTFAMIVLRRKLKDTF